MKRTVYTIFTGLYGDRAFDILKRMDSGSLCPDSNFCDVSVERALDREVLVNLTTSYYMKYAGFWGIEKSNSERKKKLGEQTETEFSRNRARYPEIAKDEVTCLKDLLTGEDAERKHGAGLVGALKGEEPNPFVAEMENEYRKFEEELVEELRQDIAAANKECERKKDSLRAAHDEKIRKLREEFKAYANRAV